MLQSVLLGRTSLRINHGPQSDRRRLALGFFCVLLLRSGSRQQLFCFLFQSGLLKLLAVSIFTKLHELSGIPRAEEQANDRKIHQNVESNCSDQPPMGNQIQPSRNSHHDCEDSRGDEEAFYREFKFHCSFNALHLASAGSNFLLSFKPQ